MFLDILLIFALAQLITRIESPGFCAGLFTVVGLFISWAFDMNGNLSAFMLLALLAARLLFSWPYFKLLQFLSDQGIDSGVFWFLALIGGAIIAPFAVTALHFGIVLVGAFASAIFFRT